MNGKKSIWLRTVKIAALLLPAVLLILLMPVNDFGDAPRIQNFYLEEPDSLDMIIIGSSEDYAGFSPVLAYEEYGFTSYPYVFSANDFSLFKGQLEEALRVQSPQLVIVDIGEVVHPRGDEYDTVYRQFMAGIPLSKHKIQLFREYGDPEECLSYFFPFIVNHGKATPQKMLEYIKLNMATRRRGFSLLKGTVTFTGSGETWDGPYVTPMNTTGDHSTTEIDPQVRVDLQAMLEACKAHPEVQYLFINYPHRITTEERYREYQQINAMGEMIESNGFDFLNLESMLDDIGLVPETDFYNNPHLNLYGQYKVTRFLCEILTKEYNLQGRALSQKTRENWDTCVEYQHLYYQLFDEEFKARAPEEFGRWLQEDLWLLQKLEEMKQTRSGT